MVSYYFRQLEFNRALRFVSFRHEEEGKKNDKAIKVASVLLREEDSIYSIISADNIS